MSTLSSWLWGTNQLDEAIDKATSELLPTGSEDIALNLEICDQIRSKSAQPKDAMRSLKRRLNHKNPNVQLLALNLTDICVKNGGDHFLVEIVSREFMDNLVSILKTPSLHRDVKSKILRCVQTWAISFKGKYHLNYVEQVYKTLKTEGFNFPPEDLAVANSALVDTQTAPEWIDSDVCLRCRDPFSFTNRKHHCRNCGRVFDQKCSSKTLPLPQFGITQEVRVCDSCHKDLTRHKDKVKHRRSSHGAAAHTFSDLERAIQLSLEEVNADGQPERPGYVSYQPDSWQLSEPPLVEHNSRRSTQAEEDDDPDLKAAIEASLREANAPKPSAPTGLETPRASQSSFSYASQGHSQPYLPSAAPAEPSVPALPNYDLAPSESDAIITFSQTIEQVQAHGGGNMSRFPEVPQLLDNANNLRPKLARSLDDAGRKEDLLTEMNNKLAQAVKLYDHILTQQVSRPTWRQQTTAPIGQHYGQWNHESSPAAVQPPPTPVAQQWHQPVYAPPQAYQAPTGVDAPYSSPPHSPQQAWARSSYISSDTGPPIVHATPVSPHYQSVPRSQSSVSRQYQYVQPTQPVSIPPPVPQPSTPTHAVGRSQQQEAPVSVQSPTIPQQVASPPHVHQQPQPPSRHNTLAHAVYAPPPTITQQQYAHRPAPAPALPSFPSVPTAPPTIPYESYESASSAVEQPKKEALLIEL